MQRSRESLPDPHAARICDAQPSAQEPSGFVVELFADFRADQTPILRSLLHFLGIDNLLEDRQICGPSLSATGAASCRGSASSREEASTFPGSFSGVIKKYGYLLDSTCPRCSGVECPRSIRAL